MPVLHMLQKRYCNPNLYDCDYYDDPWYTYGRWVLLAVIVIGAFLLFLTFSCISARRRRNQNLRPLPLTGWAYSGQNQGPYANQGAYGAGQPQGFQAPPSYQASQGFYSQGAKDNANQTIPSYGGPPPQSPYGNAGPSSPYGGQTTGVEMPEPSHQGRDSVYAPPPGPPPGKGDGIIR